jgi:hypothetical protein
MAFAWLGWLLAVGLRTYLDSVWVTYDDKQVQYLEPQEEYFSLIIVSVTIQLYL